MPKSREDFVTSAGIFDNFDGVSIEAHFGDPSGDYALSSSDPGLWIKFNSKDAEKPIEQFYSIGPKWEVKDNGARVENIEKPEAHVFSRSSNAGRLVEEAKAIIGNGDEAKGAQFFIDRDFYMTEAAFYTGWNAHWMRKTFTSQWKDQGTKETKVLCPSKWYGENKVEQSAKAQSAPSSGGGTQAGDTAALDEALIELANGKVLRDIKSEALKSTSAIRKLAGFSEYLKTIVNGKAIERLEADGRLFKGDDEKYVKV